MSVFVHFIAYEKNRPWVVILGYINLAQPRFFLSARTYDQIEWDVNITIIFLRNSINHKRKNQNKSLNVTSNLNLNI